ncbi:hypothetical protein [Streptomyces sp. NPDC056690]|uniref:hypothetical protein n=1 Tax=unclassified Streptomyces TaxID=2593676 RepID=UPI0036366CE6
MVFVRGRCDELLVRAREGRTMAQVNGGWSDVKWEDWQDADNIRRRLDQGADPEVWGGGAALAPGGGLRLT